MKRFLVMLMVALFSALLIAPDADAKRMGGGRSIGKQSDVTSRQAAPPQQAAAPAAGAAAGAAAASSRSRWMAPLAGLAAGLGLAALANWLGFGEQFATMMMLMLVVMVVLVAFRMFMARRQGGALAGAGAHGAPAAAPVNPFGQPMQRQTQAPFNGGQSSAAAGPAGAATGAAAASLIPADFDADAFVRNAKVFFVRLQAAFDKQDLEDLREFTSPEMFGELKVELLQRGAEPQTTDVVKLDGQLLGVERDPAIELASVKFSGMLRETAGGAAEPFEEIWNFSRPMNGAMGWVLAGIQQVR